jgi:hypothetical protein
LPAPGRGIAPVARRAASSTQTSPDDEPSRRPPKLVPHAGYRKPKHQLSASWAEILDIGKYKSAFLVRVPGKHIRRLGPGGGLFLQRRIVIENGFRLACIAARRVFQPIKNFHRLTSRTIRRCATIALEICHPSASHDVVLMVAARAACPEDCSCHSHSKENKAAAYGDGANRQSVAFG